MGERKERKGGGRRRGRKGGTDNLFKQKKHSPDVNF